MFKAVAVAVLAVLLAGRPLGAQAARSVPSAVDSIDVRTRNVFDSVDAHRNLLLAIANAIRFTTRTSVVRRELLFRPGEPYDSARAQESARNLRALGLFREVRIDTVRSDGRLIARVITADGWTTSLNANARSTGGTFTYSLGLTERNFFGTGTAVGGEYRSDPDRSTLAFHTTMSRVGYTPLAVAGEYDDLSDGRRGTWSFGVPFRSLSDGWAAAVGGEAAHQRILRFDHAPAADGTDSLITTTYLRRAIANSLIASVAPRAGVNGYVRTGISVSIRQEEFIAASDTLAVVPDSTRTAVGAFVEWLAPRFLVVNHYNGFARDEDVDLSTKVSVAAWVAPTAFGYESARAGIGPQVFAQTGVVLGPAFARVRASAGGVFAGGGLDSGTVAADLTAAIRWPRQATVLHVEAGSQQHPAPGAEFDLGNGVGPRAFGPHAFNGTRMIWGTVEHRVFLLDEVLKVLGLGFAGFADYGGAWYPGEAQRLGGDVGLGLRFGATRSTGTNLGRLDLAYRFGDGTLGKNRWIVSFGRSYTF
ncbi:MAG TPA: POTRA domain-containing protein [Gemmatimonadales bacterium]